MTSLPSSLVLPEDPAQAIDREYAKRHFRDFAVLAYPGYQVAPHHRLIADSLEAVAKGGIRRLAISLPPRHGKSVLASILFPAWVLGRDPEARIIACSYSADLSHTFSRQARNLLADPVYQSIFSKTKLAEDARAVGQWDIAGHRGGYVSAGVLGGITGRGMNIGICDDPVKDAEEAGSTTVLERIWEWYQTTFYSRLEKDAAIVLCMTRWSEADLMGRLLKAASEDPAADQWTIIHLPALAEEKDQLGRAPGAALWPEKFDEVALERIRVNSGSRAFAALYQQRPSPVGGSVFKREWWKRYGTFDRSEAKQVIQVWDTAFSRKETADYSACATWALTATGAYLLHAFRDRLEFPELKRKAKDLYAAWKPSAVLIEDKASGQSLIQEFERETRIPLLAISVGSDKVSRAHAVTPPIEAGRVFVPESAPWVDEFLEEHAAFPAGAHDDWVDTTGMALTRLFGLKRVIRWA